MKRCMPVPVHILDLERSCDWALTLKLSDVMTKLHMHACFHILRGAFVSGARAGLGKYKTFASRFGAYKFDSSKFT